MFVAIDQPSSGKGTLSIEFPVQEDEVKIKELIGGDTIFGFPYRLTIF